MDYVHGFSPKARDILEHLEFEKEIAKLDDADILYSVVSRFAEIDPHPEVVSNIQMGYIFEGLIRDHVGPRAQLLEEIVGVPR
jgi:type I restriction enzyme M protein